MFPVISMEKRLKRLEPPKSKVRIVLDTDTYNEIDDQFAVVHALLSPERIQVEALYAAPFYNALSTGPKDGMEKSFAELQRILSVLERNDVPVYRGSESYFPAAGMPVESAAARDLVERAMTSTDDDPLYVLAIGAITNVASALLLEPAIANKIVVVWLGGHALYWKDTREFNLKQDIHAASTVLDCGVPLVLLPCMGVVSHLQTTLAELGEHVRGCGRVGSYLYETFERSAADHFAYSRVIWDLAATAWIVQPDWLPTSLVPSPLLADDCRWSFDRSRHFIRIVDYVNRDKIFRDLFTKLQTAAGRGVSDKS